MTTSRRDFLLTTGAGAMAGMLSGSLAKASFGGSTQPMPRVRKDVTSPSAAADIASYKVAVEKMKQLSQSDPNNPIGWVKQAEIHGTIAGGFGKCQHGSWFFAPWHRAYLYYFEQIVASLSGNASFALPYWDWSRTHTIPDAFWGAGNTLLDNTRRMQPNQPFSATVINEFVGLPVINGLLADTDFASMWGDDIGGGEFEFTPHNQVHVQVGGNMMTGASPLDPLFWCHHCNVDRLYSEWLGRRGHFPPTAPAWRDKTFNDFADPMGNPAGGELTVAKMLDSRDLGYVYAEQTRFDFALAPTRGWSEVGRLTSATPLLADGGFSFATEPLTDPKLVQGVSDAVAGSRNEAVRVRIKNLPFPEASHLAVRVFVNCESPSTKTPITDPSYVGSISFFGQHGERDHGHGQNYVLNATRALRSLYGDVKIPEKKEINVSLVTVPIIPENAAPAPTKGGPLKAESVAVEVVALQD